MNTPEENFPQPASDASPALAQAPGSRLLSGPMCKRCQERGQTWHGDAPVCVLSGANWNCATISAIREICGEWESPHPRVEHRFCDDQKYATIQINECVGCDGGRIGLALWVTWYKRRGSTDAMWILSDDAPPRQPTIEELEIIIRSFVNT